MTTFWSCYISLLVIVNIVGCLVLLWVTRRNTTGISEGKELEHSFDGITELNNPLPKWWLWCFIITIVFSVAYLYLYPGLGNYQGALKWTSRDQWQQEVSQADKEYAPIFERYGKQPIEQLVKNERAMEVGQRIFASNCAMCHGSDARGAKGFPNLTAGEWIYGGLPQDIETTIMYGRQGMMPPQADAIGGRQAVEMVAEYILSLNKKPHDELLAAQGKEKFMTVCAACHGQDASGNKYIGAPNLIKSSWLFGDNKKTLQETITNGRQSMMPAHEHLLGKDKVHLVAAYVYSLTANKK